MAEYKLEQYIRDTLVKITGNDKYYSIDIMDNLLMMGINARQLTYLYFFVQEYADVKFNINDIRNYSFINIYNIVLYTTQCKERCM